MRMIPVVSRMCAVLFPGPSYCFLMVQQITVDIEAEFPHSSSDFLLFKRCEYLCRCAHTCVHRLWNPEDNCTCHPQEGHKVSSWPGAHQFS